MNKAEIIEQLQCALINCDNVKTLGMVGVGLVKMQIQSALDLIEGEEENNLLDKTLEEPDVTVRTYNCLKRAGVDTVGDLIKMSEDDLHHVRNMGRKCVEEIIEKLKGIGLELREDGD